MRWLLLGFGVTLLIFLAGGILFMLESTVINPWVFFGIVFMVAAATGTVLHRAWEKITGTCKFYINYPLHLVVATILLSSAVLMTNYFPSDFSKFPEEKVIVEQKLRKTRYKTRRVSRRVYARGTPYYVYYLKITLPDGSPKEVYVKKTVYDKARTGDTATVRIGRGALSFPVFDQNSLKLLHPHVKSTSRSRCKFFGTSGRRTVTTQKTPSHQSH